MEGCVVCWGELVCGVVGPGVWFDGVQLLWTEP